MRTSFLVFSQTPTCATNTRNIRSATTSRWVSHELDRTIVQNCNSSVTNDRLVHHIYAWSSDVIDKNLRNCRSFRLLTKSRSTSWWSMAVMCLNFCRTFRADQCQKLCQPYDIVCRLLCEESSGAAFLSRPQLPSRGACKSVQGKACCLQGLSHFILVREVVAVKAYKSI